MWRTGVNGGFIANPAVRFGANCFGYKPKITSEEQDAMDTASEYPKTRKDMALREEWIIGDRSYLKSLLHLLIKVHE